MHLVRQRSGFETRLDAALAPPAAELVEAYYELTGPFAAATFDLLGANDPMRITVADLLAVTLLNVLVPAHAVRALLGDEAETISELLAAVPPDVALWDAGDSDLDAATALWGLLEDHAGIGWVTAGKLLSRKRPHMIPVIDSVIERVLRPPSGRFWATLRMALRDESRRAAVEALRPPGLTLEVSTLRLLDVAIWMRHSDGTNARREQSRLGLAVAPRPPR